jgi:hypothetical protein
LRPADRAKEHRIRPPARVEHAVRERGAVGVDRGAADELLVELDAAELFEDAPRRGDDLRPDSVPR